MLPSVQNNGFPVRLGEEVCVDVRGQSVLLLRGQVREEPAGRPGFLADRDGHDHPGAASKLEKCREALAEPRRSLCSVRMQDVPGRGLASGAHVDLEPAGGDITGCRI